MLTLVDRVFVEEKYGKQSMIIIFSTFSLIFDIVIVVDVIFGATKITENSVDCDTEMLN